MNFFFTVIIFIFFNINVISASELYAYIPECQNENYSSYSEIIGNTYLSENQRYGLILERIINQDIPNISEIDKDRFIDYEYFSHKEHLQLLLKGLIHYGVNNNKSYDYLLSAYKHGDNDDPFCKALCLYYLDRIHDLFLGYIAIEDLGTGLNPRKELQELYLATDQKKILFPFYVYASLYRFADGEIDIGESKARKIFLDCTRQIESDKKLAFLKDKLYSGIQKYFWKVDNLDEVGYWAMHYLAIVEDEYKDEALLNVAINFGNFNKIDSMSHYLNKINRQNLLFGDLRWYLELKLLSFQESGHSDSIINVQNDLIDFYTLDWIPYNHQHFKWAVTAEFKNLFEIQKNLSLEREKSLRTTFYFVFLSIFLLFVVSFLVDQIIRFLRRSKFKEFFYSIITHDLKAPLQSLINNLEHTNPDEISEEVKSMLTVGLKKLFQFTKETSHLVRVDNRDIYLSKNHIFLEDVRNQFLAFIISLYPSINFDVVLYLDNSRSFITHGQKEGLFAILRNLISNSVIHGKAQSIELNIESTNQGYLFKMLTSRKLSQDELDFFNTVLDVNKQNLSQGYGIFIIKSNMQQLKIRKIDFSNKNNHHEASFFLPAP